MIIIQQIINFIDQGGVISWVLTGMYFLVMTVTVERTIFFARRMCDYSKVENLLRSSTVITAPELLKNAYFVKKKNSQIVSMLSQYINHRNLSEKAFNEAIDRKGFKLVAEMERHLWILSQVGHLGPLLGLLGTVVGLIEAFRIMSQMGASSDVASFASGIWVAMITTALGLIVAIPAFFIFRIFEKIVEKRSTQMSYVISILNQLYACEVCPTSLGAYNKNTESSSEEDIYETF